MVESYEVMWNGPSADDSGRAVFTNGSTKHTITELMKQTSYIITVTVTNVAGSISSGSISIETSDGKLAMG